MRLDTDTAAKGRLAYVRRVPKGPVLAISPFNFPLNLVAHKVAPAIAVGAPVVLKPAPKTPLSALLLGELSPRPTCRPGMVNVINVQTTRPRTSSPTTAAARRLVHRLRAGRLARSRSRPAQARRARARRQRRGRGLRRLVERRDLDWAATRIATFANYQAGQSCIGVQRVYADAGLYDALRRAASSRQGRGAQAPATRTTRRRTSAR